MDRPAQPRTQRDYYHDTKVKPDAAAAVIELLMMNGKTPETCWAVNKGQDNKMENCCIWFVIYLNFKENVHISQYIPIDFFRLRILILVIFCKQMGSKCHSHMFLCIG